MVITLLSIRVVNNQIGKQEAFPNLRLLRVKVFIRAPVARRVLDHLTLFNAPAFLMVQVIYAANVADADLANGNDMSRKVFDLAKQENSAAVLVSAQVTQPQQSCRVYRRCWACGGGGRREATQSSCCSP